MPVVVFNEKDALQHDVLAARGVAEPPVRAPGADLGRLPRGGLPRPGLGDGARAAARTGRSTPGRLVPLGGRLHLDVPLHWQRWRLDSPVLDRLTDAVRRRGRARPEIDERPGPEPDAGALVSSGSAAGQKADSSRSISSRSMPSAMARSAEIFGSTFCAKNCAAATLPS